MSYPKNSDRDLAEKEGHEVQLKKRKENDPKGGGQQQNPRHLYDMANAAKYQNTKSNL